MPDYYFKQWYDSVKGTEWPNESVTDLVDFYKIVDKKFIDESYKFLNLDSRLTEIENPNYWKWHSNQNWGYRKHNVVYVPVYKCGHSYYENFFHIKLGWEKVSLIDIDWNDKIFAFGLIMHPLTRRLKGLTQSLMMHFTPEEITDNLIKFTNKISIHDIHSFPYSLTYGELLSKIYWIPLEMFDDINEIKIHIEKILLSQGISVTIPRDDPINQSSPFQLGVYVRLTEYFLNIEAVAELYQLYAEDLKFYHRLIKGYLS